MAKTARSQRKHKAGAVEDWPVPDDETMRKVKRKFGTGWRIRLREDK